MVRRSTYQNSTCAEQIKLNGMDLLNEGICAIDSSIEISGRLFEALRDLYEHTNRDKMYIVTKDSLSKLKLFGEEIHIYVYN